LPFLIQTLDFHETLYNIHLMLQKPMSKMALAGTETLAAPVTKLNILSHPNDKGTTRPIVQLYDIELEELGRVP